MRVSDTPQLAQLSTTEKILLVEDLWDSIAPGVKSMPVPDSHKEELDCRWGRHASDPDALLSLEQLQARIENRK